MIEPRIPASAYPSHCVAPRYLHVLEAAIHLIKGNLGPGLFAMPLQFATVGPFVGLFCLATVATQGLYCMWLLCLLYTSPSPRDQRGSRMPSSA